MGVFSIKYSGLGLICLNHVSLVLYVKHSIEKAQLYICPIEVNGDEIKCGSVYVDLTLILVSYRAS